MGHHELLAEYEATLADGDFEAAEALQARLDVVGWTVEHRVDALLDRLGAPPREAETARLSGGERRRVTTTRAVRRGAVRRARCVTLCSSARRGRARASSGAGMRRDVRRASRRRDYHTTERMCICVSLLLNAVLSVRARVAR